MHTAILGIDIETYSEVDIDVGAEAYAEHPSTGVHVVCGAFMDDGGQVFERWTWSPSDPIPKAFAQHVLMDENVCAHNAGFESAILRHILCPRYGWPVIYPEQWVDTAACAALFGLPVKLEGLCTALGTAIKKDAEGAKLMRRLSKGPKITAAELERLTAYCMTDVEAMLGALSHLPKPGIDELELQAIDRRINERGMPIDTRYVEQLSSMLSLRLKSLNTDTFHASDADMVSVAKSAGPLKKHLQRKGVDVETLTRDDLDDLLAQPDLADDIRTLLMIRKEASRTASLAKLARVPQMVSQDGRLRGVLRYCGAHTGRWASSGLQVHNLPRSRKTDDYDPARLRDAVIAGDLKAATAASPDLLRGLSWQLRSVIAAPPGYEIVGGDYSAIEARVVAWLAGQDDVLQLFAEGRDVYTEDAARVGSNDRQLGKVQRLGFGYGMSALKAQEAAAAYGVELTVKEAFRAVSIWRAHNGRIVDLWHNLERAAHTAISHPGRAVGVGQHLVCYFNGKALRITLPSGRSLHYWRPKSVETTRRLKVAKEDGSVVEKDVNLTELRYWVESPSRNGMAIEHSYGGKLVENVTQAVAREILAHALRLLDKHPIYQVVLHVHDSIASEVRAGTGDVREFCQIMCNLPAWAKGLPIAAEGYRGPRFKG